MTVQETVLDLINKHGTSDPFKIAELMGIKVIFEPLGNSMGYFSCLYRTAIIHINDNLPYEKQLLTCAHELGHITLHPEINTAFLKANTYYSHERYEKEANEFMIELLFKQGSNQVITTKEIYEDYGIPEKILAKIF